MPYDAGSGYRYFKTGVVSDNRMLGAAFDNIAGGRAGYKHIPDDNLHSGTDAYLCSQDSRRFFRNDDFRFMDTDQADRLHYGALVELQYIHQVMLLC